MVRGLKDIAKDIATGSLQLDPALEDVHMNIEKELTVRIGSAGAKLHTGRSRNDQVALDVRLAVREFIQSILADILDLQGTLLKMAGEASGAVMPGYTHMQHAQPVLLSHYLLAHFWKLDRDFSRLLGCYGRTNISPLGSGALAGVTYEIDRNIVCDMLAMEGITENSLDAVSDRDFVAEFAFCLSLLMIHLSSVSEELVLWSTTEFGFLKLPKRLAGGSSMMPQKVNPDIPELVRGKSSRTLGNLIAVLTLMKSLPLAYNRDLQEDKENLFDSFDTTEASLHALTSFLAETEFDKVRMRKAAEVGLMTATDIADFLTGHGIPFRESYNMVRQLAKKSGGDDVKFKELAKAMLVKTVECRTSDLNFLSVDKSIARRKIAGGTSKRAVAIQMAEAKRTLENSKKSVAVIVEQTSSIDRLLA
jgi:argininosuccinate lyase